MEIMGKCPFFNEPCLKEGCSAFQYIEHCLWEYEEDPRYKAFKKERKPHITEHNEWFAVGIPYCRVLDKELPMKVTEK
jgi:hypothetical protein